MSVLGFDFGTQFCQVAAAQKRGIDVLDNEASSRKTPSIITFDNEERGIGEAAGIKFMRNLKNSVWALKHLLGRQYKDEAAQRELARLACVSKELDDGSIGIQVRYQGEQRVFRPEQLAGMLLAKMADTAQQKTGLKVAHSVVSAPAWYDEAARRALLDAAKIANIHCVEVMSEPAATALVYGIYKKWEKEPKHVAFIDFGYSACTCSIAEFSSDGVRVLASASNRMLGGREFDHALSDWVAAQILEKYSINVKENARQSKRLEVASERVKKTLSANPDAQLFLENIAEDVDVQIPVKRDQLESLLSDVLSQLVPTMQACFDGANKRKQQLDKDAEPITVESVLSVEVIGGSWRIPIVQKIIEDYFHREISKTLNAEETISRGCAIRAAQISPLFSAKKFKIKDATPYPIHYRLYDANSSPAEPIDARIVFRQYQSTPCKMQFFTNRTEPFKVAFEYSVSQTTAASPSLSAASSSTSAPETSVPDHVERNVIAIYEVPEIPKTQDPEQIPRIQVIAGLDSSGTAYVNAVMEEKITVVETSTPDKPKDDGKDSCADMTDDDKQKAQDASKMTDDAAAGDEQKKDDAGDDEKKDDGAAAASSDAKPKIKTHRTRLAVVPVHILQLSHDVLGAAITEESKMQASDRLVMETNEARNKLEEIIYDVRSKIKYGEYTDFATSEEAETISRETDEIEDWLYEDGADATKEVYEQKITDFRKLSDPIARRFRENEARPIAVNHLTQTINKWRQIANSKDEKYAHIAQEDRDKVIADVDAAEAWLKQNMEKTLLPTDDPHWLAVDIESRANNLENSCYPHMNKPKPAPPKPKEDEQKPASATSDDKQDDQKPASATSDDQKPAPMDDDQKEQTTSDNLFELD